MLRPSHSPVSMNSLPGCCSFAGRLYRLSKEQHAGFLNCWYLLGLFSHGFLSLQSFPVILFFLTETRRLWFRIVFGISGFAIGIDLMAAQIVQSLKPSCPGMTLTAAIPFRGQADRFSANDKMVYENLVASADEVLILSERYYTRCFLDRDEFMVENASLLIAFSQWPIRASLLQKV